MAALVNIELYQSLKTNSIERFNYCLNQLIGNAQVKAILSNESINELNQRGISSIEFTFEPILKFRYFVHEINLKEEWIVQELCIEYDRVLDNINKQTVYNKGVKEVFVKIIKLLNRCFESPAIVITSEIENGYFFEHNFGNGSQEFAGFELALLKNSNKFKNIDTYRTIEETNEYNILIQESRYVGWN